MSNRMLLKDWQLLTPDQRKEFTQKTIKYLIDIIRFEGLRLLEAEHRAKKELGISTNVMADITTTKEFKTLYAQAKLYKLGSQSL